MIFGLRNALLNLEFIVKKVTGFVFPRRNIKNIFASNEDVTIIECSESNSSFEFSLESTRKQVYFFKGRSIQEVEDVILDTKIGNVYQDGNKLVLASSSWPASELDKNSYNGSNIFSLFRKSKVHQDLLYTSLPSNGYYHWLIEDLPRFMKLKDSYEQSFITIIYNRHPRYVTDYCKMAKVEFVKAPRIVFLPKMFIAQKNQETGVPNPNDIEILRNSLCQGDIENSDEKIFVSRLASLRSPSWERELILLLQKRNWKIVYCEELKLQDQIEIFEGAGIICGVHGAGLANMVWAKPGSTIIELNDSFRSNCFKFLAQIMRHDFIQIDSAGLTAKEIENRIVGHSLYF